MSSTGLTVRASKRRFPHEQQLAPGCTAYWWRSRRRLIPLRSDNRTRFPQRHGGFTEPQRPASTRHPGTAIIFLSIFYDKYVGREIEKNSVALWNLCASVGTQIRRCQRPPSGRVFEQARGRAGEVIVTECGDHLNRNGQPMRIASDGCDGGGHTQQVNDAGVGEREGVEHCAAVAGCGAWVRRHDQNGAVGEKRIDLALQCGDLLESAG